MPSEHTEHGKEYREGIHDFQAERQQREAYLVDKAQREPTATA